MQRRPARSWAAVLLLALSAAPGSLARAQPAPSYQTRSGLAFTPPSTLHAVAVPAALSGKAQTVEYAFSDASEAPLQLFVVSAPLDPDVVLPADSASAREQYAQGFSDGARALLPQAVALQPLTAAAYDPTRGAIALTLQAVGPSRAHMLLVEPEGGPVWREVRARGEDPSLLRCFLTRLLDGENSLAEARLQGNAAAAAERCGVPRARIERFIASAGAASFAPSSTRIDVLAFLMRSSVVAFYVAAPDARAQDVAAVAAALWSTTSPPAALRLDAALFDAAPGSAWSQGRLLGFVLGAFCALSLLGGASAWLLHRRLQLPAARAVGLAFAALDACTLIGLVAGGATGSAWLQLVCYLVASAVLYRPVSRFIATPRPAAPSRAAHGGT
jgi:hypothetical protein